MRVYLCGDTAHDPGLKGEQGHAEGEQRKNERAATGPNGGVLGGDIVRSVCEARFKYDKEIKVL